MYVYLYIGIGGWGFDDMFPGSQCLIQRVELKDEVIIKNHDICIQMKVTVQLKNYICCQEQEQAI